MRPDTGAQVASTPGLGAPALAGAQRALLAAVGAGASLEQVCERLDLGAAAASRVLLELELLGQLRAEPGLWWTRC
jgi:DNA processing protein